MYSPGLLICCAGMMMVLPLITVSQAQEETCNGENEVYSTCGSSCPKTCENLNTPMQCIQQCQVGCFCKKNFVRNSEGECIDASECPKESCPDNEVPSNCVVPCNDCSTKGKCNFLVCNAGCDCEEGFFRDTNGICIPESDCPPKTCSGKNEVYSECGSCEKTCKNLGTQLFCTKECRAGCFCKKHFVRDAEGKCIRASRCPKGSCPKHEIPTDCVNSCNDCSRKENCKSDISGPGCDCKRGYCRDDSGTCVPKSSRPKQASCPRNETLVDCVTPCTACKYVKSGCPIRVRCEKGCDCKDGYARNENKDCVLVEDCNFDQE